MNSACITCPRWIADLDSESKFWFSDGRWQHIQTCAESALQRMYVTAVSCLICWSQHAGFCKYSNASMYFMTHRSTSKSAWLGSFWQVLTSFRLVADMSPFLSPSRTLHMCVRVWPDWVLMALCRFGCVMLLRHSSSWITEQVVCGTKSRYTKCHAAHWFSWKQRWSSLNLPRGFTGL